MFKTVIEREKDKEDQCAAFILDMQREVFGSYAVGNQIKYDGRFNIPHLPNDNRADVMRVAIVGLRETLYRIWPRAREITYVIQASFILPNLMDCSEDNASKSSETKSAFVKVYNCRCWASPKVVINGYQSESCEGQIFVAITEPNPEEYQVRYKVHHD